MAKKDSSSRELSGSKYGIFASERPAHASSVNVGGHGEESFSWEIAFDRVWLSSFPLWRHRNLDPL